jgi:uncharacterized protein YbjT (DUF2867 family)
MILVTGAAGKTGLAVIRAIARQGERVRALVRRNDQVQVVIDAGAGKSISGDMIKASTFNQALKDIDVVYHICPNVSPHEVEIGRHLIRACIEQGVNRIAYHSVLHPQTEDMPHHWAKLQVEELLIRSGLDFTILQPGAYMQNVQGNWKGIIEEGRFTVPYPVDTRLSMVDLQDVAEVASRVMLNPKYSGAIFELVGPETLNPQEIAEILTDELGLQVSAQEESLEAWKSRMEGSQLGGYQRSALIKMFEHYAKYSFTGNGFVLRQLLDRESTTFRNFIRRVLVTE